MGARPSSAQTIVVLVNDDPITSYDVTQRERWMSRTNGFGDRMKALLTGPGIQERFRQMMVAANPRSQAEAQQVAERIKKELVEDAKRRALSEGASSSRKAAIDALIEDRLKLQAAKKFDIKISDKEVEESLSQRAIGPDGKPHLAEFFQQFENDGINKRTIQEIIRAQLAWRDVIRRQYGPRLASIMASIQTDDQKPSDNDILYDVRVLKLAVADASDQKAVSQRMLEAENLRGKFTSCDMLAKEAGLVASATVRAVEKAKLASFPQDVQPLISKASDGQMTPPVLIGGAVESYAVCRRSAVQKQQATPAQPKSDPRQEEYERFSKRYLQELKQSASIDYRGT